MRAWPKCSEPLTASWPAGVLPDTGINRGLAGSLLSTWMVPAWEPIPVGWNRTETSAEPPLAMTSG